MRTRPTDAADSALFITHLFWGENGATIPKTSQGCFSEHGRRPEVLRVSEGRV